MKHRKLLAAVLALALLLLCVVGCKAKGEIGDKTITITVTWEGETEEITVDTDQEMLGAALLEKDLISGSDSEYGLFVDTVNGHYADPDLGQWWVFTKDGEMVATGVDSTPIVDGDAFEWYIYE